MGCLDSRGSRTWDNAALVPVEVVSGEDGETKGRGKWEKRSDRPTPYDPLLQKRKVA